MMDISSTDKDVHDSDVLKDVAPVLKETIPDIIRDVNEKTEVLIKNSIKMLDLWKLVYFENKKKMEKNNVVQLLRKFNEYEVFERFNIVHLILADLQKIIQIIRQLKAIRPEIQYIVIETDEKKLFFEYITKVFLQLNTELYEVDIETWKGIKDTFFKNLENRLCMNIHVAIKVSRHVVNDYKVLAFFENLLKRDKFVKQLSKEYPVICDKFINKIKHLENQFELLTTISHPMRNQPPVSGSLILVTALLLRAERDVTVFRRTTKFRPEQKNKSLLAYDKFSEKITSYKNNIFTKWLNNAIEIERRQMQEVLLDFHANKLVSKFNKELIGVIDEAIELSALGYDLPEIIINLINRRSHIIENVIKIDALVKIYNDIINKMDAPITLAMDQHMKKIRRLLHPGLKIPGFILSLQLPKFVDDISGSIKCINMIYTEMEVLETSMFKEIQSIENLTFFQFDNDDIQELETAFDRFKEQGNKNLTVIMHAMVVISGTLNMIENICCGIKTGRNKQMILFYEKYETAVFEALIEMVLRNVETFKKILNGDRAVFVVHGRSTDDKLAVVPNIADVTATFVGAVDDVLGRLQTVPRWLSTTNILCPVVVDEESDFRHLYSFYDHVRDRQHVENALGECYKSIETIGNRLETTARKFQKFSFLFERRTDLMIDQFAATNPTLKDYVNQLEFFSQLSNGFRSQSYIDVGCVRFDYSEYNDKLIDRCDFWLSMYGEQLMRDCNAVMSAFTEKITTPEKFIYSRLKDAEEFDVVEHSIKEIKKMVFLADLTFNDIQNRFDLMIKHKLNIPKDCFLKYNNFKKKWKNLYEEALRKSFLIRKASKLLARSSS